MRDLKPQLRGRADQYDYHVSTDCDEPRPITIECTGVTATARATRAKKVLMVGQEEGDPVMLCREESRFDYVRRSCRNADTLTGAIVCSKISLLQV